MTQNRDHRHGLALVGLRGTGKSTVGRILAERLGRPFADADVELEARAGRTIAAIFAESGEPAFRDWEARVLDELAGRGDLVLSTGGGVVLRESNRRRLRAFGTVVWLAADPAVIATRLAASPQALAGRPALTAAGTLRELAAVLETRAPLYQEVADLVVATDLLSVDQVVEAILDVWPGRQEECR